jgi:hypothetical protein
MAPKTALTRAEIVQVAGPPIVLAVGFTLLVIYVEPGKSAPDELFAPWTEWAMRIMGLIWIANIIRIARRRGRTPA